MNVFSVYTLDQAEEWDAVARSFKDYDVYWLSGYAKGFSLRGDATPLLLFYDDGTTRGMNVVMKRDVAKDARFSGKIPEGRYFDYVTPYGYGGWLVEGNDASKLFQTYETQSKKRGIVSEFARFHPVVQNADVCRAAYEVVPLGEVVCVDLTSPETIWSNLSSKNRNMVRKALKNDVRIYNGRFPEIFEKFRGIYNETMDRDDASDFYYFEPEFYKSILDDLPQNAQVFWAEKDARVVAASIMLSTNGKMNYHLSGSLREYLALAPNNLLLYRAALWGCANGCKTLYLGGGVGSEQDNLFAFKRGFFKGDLRRFQIGKKIFNQDAYDELLNLRGDVETPRFFPAYRG